MSCTYTFQGRTYNATEMHDVLAAMPFEDIMQFLPNDVKEELVRASSASKDSGIIEETRRKADELKAMDEDTLDNLDPYDFGYRSYMLYEAEKMMPKKDGAFKSVNDDNSFQLWNEADAVVNVNGKPFLATKQEDPDDDEDEGLYVWSFSDPSNPNDEGYTTAWSDKADAVGEFKDYLKDKPLFSKIENQSKRTPFVAQDDDSYLPTLNRVIGMFESDDRRKHQEAGNTPIPICRTPVVLRQVIEHDGSKPFKRSDYIVGQGSTLYLKAENIHSKSLHSGKVGLDVLRDIPQLLSDPLAIFKSSSSSEDTNSFKVLIDAKDENGNPVVIAIKPNVNIRSLGNSVAHLQASIFPVTNEDIKRWVNNGDLRYYNEKSHAARVVGSNPRESGDVETSHTRLGFDATVGEKNSQVKVIKKGDIEEMPSSAYSVDFNIADFRGKIEAKAPNFANTIRDLFNTSKTFNWWHKSLGTQYHKAFIDKQYGRVYRAAESLEQDTARIASEAADLAPELVPKMDTLGQSMSQDDYQPQRLRKPFRRYLTSLTP